MRNATTYRAKDVQELTGLSRIQVIHLVEQGAVVPLEDAQGRGAARLYSRQNLAEFFLCRELLRLQVPVAGIARITGFLRDPKSPDGTPGLWAALADDPGAAERYFLFVFHGSLVARIYDGATGKPKDEGNWMTVAGTLDEVQAAMLKVPGGFFVNTPAILRQVAG